MSPSRTRPVLPERQLRLAWQSSSLLLGYPDEELLARVPLLREAADQLPQPVAGPLGAFLAYLGSTPLPVVAEAYVATFDHQKRCCPYLTWFVHGDTRNRGVALLRFKSTYRAAGMELDDGELPDHLAVLLEFGATADPAAAWDLLLQHRAGVELLRLALIDTGSAWSSVVRAVCATLPPLAGNDREAVAALAAQGPPVEEVGLAPFAPPEYMPEPRRPVSLPLPTYTPSARGTRP